LNNKLDPLNGDKKKLKAEVETTKIGSSRTKNFRYNGSLENRCHIGKTIIKEKLGEKGD
jgi:hypothetical protein